MDDDLLSTGDFSKPVFNNDEYVDEIKLDAKRRIAEKEKFMDDGKKGMKPSSPMKKGTFEMNKNFNSLHTGDLYQVRLRFYPFLFLPTKIPRVTHLLRWLCAVAGSYKLASPPHH